MLNKGKPREAPPAPPPMVKPASADDIPEALRDYDHWICWKWEWREDRLTKMPLRRTGQPAKSNDPTTWCSFDYAFGAARVNPQIGIGFVLDRSAGIIGIDVDHCINDDGEVKSWAEPILKRFAETYAEISPSGRGVKIFCRGGLDAFAVNTGTRKPYHDGQVECYRCGRYFTVTGRRFRDAPLQITDHQGDVDWLMAELGVPRAATSKVRVMPSPRSESTPPAPDLSASQVERIQAIVAAARENDPKLAALLDGQLCDYASASEADLAACSRLAALGLSRDEIDAVIRASRRMRDKWDQVHFSDGRTYSQATIDRALSPSPRSKSPPSAPPVDADDDEEDDDDAESSAPSDPLQYLLRTRAFRGLPLRGVQKIGRRQAQYYLLIAGHDPIDIGTASQVLQARHVQAVMADAIGRVIPSYKHTRWNKIAQRIFLLGGAGQDVPGVDRRSETLEWLSMYLSHNKPALFTSQEELIDYLKESHNRERPLTDGVYTYIRLEDFRTWLFLNLAERVGRRDMILRLQHFGFAAGSDGRLQVREGQKVYSRRYWRSPAGFDPDAT